MVDAGGFEPPLLFKPRALPAELSAPKPAGGLGVIDGNR